MLKGSEKEAAESLLKQLAEYGIFVVVGGELEMWLKSLGAVGHSPNWLISIFEKMGDDPTDSDYVKPATGDVWDFVGDIKKWITSSTRRGIPD